VDDELLGGHFDEIYYGFEEAVAANHPSTKRKDSKPLNFCLLLFSNISTEKVKKIEKKVKEEP
jgi:hypothetical protein